MARVRGHRGLDKALRDFVRAMQTPVSAASRHALRPVLSAAKRNLARNDSVETGKLRESLTIRKDPKAPRERPRHLVGPRSDSDRTGVAHLVEFGTAPHMVGRKMHPGARAKPFMRPALDENADEAVKRFGERLGPEIDKAARKVRRKVGDDS